MHDKHQGKKQHSNLLELTVYIVIKMADTLPAGFYDVHFQHWHVYLTVLCLHSQCDDSNGL